MNDKNSKEDRVMWYLFVYNTINSNMNYRKIAIMDKRMKRLKFNIYIYVAKHNLIVVYKKKHICLNIGVRKLVKLKKL